MNDWIYRDAGEAEEALRTGSQLTNYNDKSL